MTTSRRVGLVSLLCLAACSTRDPKLDVDSPVGGSVYTPESPDAPAPEPTFRFFPANADGSLAPGDTFAAHRLAYLAASGSGAVPGDYYFQVNAFVNTPSGIDIFFASSDRAECRRFRVSESGAIEQVFASDCAHAQSTDATNGGLTVQLMPFDLALDTIVRDGDRLPYMVQVAPFPESFNGDFPTFRFFVSETPPTAPVCGDGTVNDGEECDDGNTDYNDGCSGVCRTEHLCCCGNGVLEPGEQCDDGNHEDGDQCSSTCRLP